MSYAQPDNTLRRWYRNDGSYADVIYSTRVAVDRRYSLNTYRASMMPDPDVEHYAYNFPDYEEFAAWMEANGYTLNRPIPGTTRA